MRELPGAVSDRRHIAGFVQKYPWVHLGVTLLGNAAFIAGSVLFLLEVRTTAIWAFLLGSTAMLLGSLGELIRWIGQRRLRSYGGTED
jgi:hypothetical protein